MKRWTEKKARFTWDRIKRRLSTPIASGVIEERASDSISPDQVTYLYTMVLLVAHVDKAEGVGGDAPGIIEATVGGALRAEGPEETTGRIEHLDPMVVTVRDDVLADPVYGHPGEAVEFALAAPVRTELLHEVPITVEYLRGEQSGRPVTQSESGVVYIDRAILKSVRGRPQ